jgi:ATPase subunit of ABC transporter with duplicated ATPase domains
MKIISLEAENYKRLKAIEITPDGNTVVIAGRNAQGKTSVLDAIWAALGGREGNKASKPIREGAETAKVRVDLGDIVVTRTWKGDTSTVKVESGEGAVYKSPQALLDSFIGKLSFDPLEFTRMSAREQREALLELVDLDVDLGELDSKRAALFDKRTAVGRDGKALGEEPKLDGDLPSEEVSAASIIALIREAQELDRSNAGQISTLVGIDDDVISTTSQIQRFQESLKSLQKAQAEQRAIVEALPVPADVTELESSLSEVETTNYAIRQNNAARERVATIKEQRTAYETLTDEIAAMDRTKADALAKAKFPVDGLGFDDSGVSYQDVPFDQASSAEQIRVSLGMAIALNPKLRVIRILDGSLLDDDNMKMISAAAAEHDFQVWIERVGDNGSVGIVIEDGEVIE